MNFDNEKKQCLEKIDNSKKQSIDSGIKKIVDLLNSKENYYTTSSCSGTESARASSGRTLM